MNICDKALVSDVAILSSQCLGEWTLEELLLLLDQMEQCNLDWYFRCAPAFTLSLAGGLQGSQLS